MFCSVASAQVNISREDLKEIQAKVQELKNKNLEVVSKSTLPKEKNYLINIGDVIWREEIYLNALQAMLALHEKSADPESTEKMLREWIQKMTMDTKSDAELIATFASLKIGDTIKEIVTPLKVVLEEELTLLSKS